FPHANVFYSWGYCDTDFNQVKTISSAELAAISEGAAQPFRDGSLFRGTAESIHGKEASAVFVVSDGKLKPIKSAAIYQALYNDPNWSLVTWVPDDLLSKFAYELGTAVDSSAIHPNGSLVRYVGEEMIYLIDNGQKRAFSSTVALLANGYDLNKIVVIPTSEVYIDGSAIGSLADELTTPIFTTALIK
ncbi:MAG: hypothetical protein KAS12_04965, partial [Candidatus Aenigmarchaeota archaeon]|nr:hypothetical protein [Candidatus Aenigmarchaeota archaeon]